MEQCKSRTRTDFLRPLLVPGLTLGLLLGGGCASQVARYTSPQEASDALVAALDPELDVAALETILGPGIDDVVSSGDDVYDEENRRLFVAEYRSRRAFEVGEDGNTYVTVGDDEWPFPIPLVERSGGWSFDTEAGRDELLSRRIGRNELDTIQTVLAIADAQLDYAMLDLDGNGVLDYAQRFLSRPGQRDGLYWPDGDGGPASPIGPLLAEATAEGYELPSDPDAPGRVYHGYRFRILTRQGASADGGALDYVVDGRMIGGFAILAWPATYGNSGIMTFMVNQDGVVWERDFGTRTEAIAREITEYDPDESWSRVNETAFVLEVQ